MSAPPNRLPLILGAVALLAVGIGGAVWALQPEPEPEAPAEEPDDSGLTRDETEAQMRTIGYVQ